MSKRFSIFVTLCGLFSYLFIGPLIGPLGACGSGGIIACNNEVGDDFTVNSQNCWQLGFEGTTTWTTWSDLSENHVLTFNTSNGTLDYNTTSLSNDLHISLYKLISIDPSGFELIFHLGSASGFDDGAQGDDDVLITLAENYSAIGEGAGKYILFGISSDPTNVQRCVVSYDRSDNLGPEAELLAVSDCSANNSYYFKLTMNQSSTTIQWSTDGATYQDFENFVNGSFPVSEDFSNIQYLTLNFENGGNDNVASIDSIVTSGITLAE